MRILYTANAAWYFAQARLPLAMAALAAGYEVHLAAPEDETVPILEKAGLRFHRIPVQRKSVNPFRETQALAAIWRTFKSIKPSIAHNFAHKPVLYGSAAARILRCPTVNTICGLGYLFISDSPKAILLRKLVGNAYRHLFRHGVLCTFENHDDERTFISQRIVPRERTRVIPGTGVDCRRFSPVPGKPDGLPIVLLGARMLWDKGIGEFVEAARELSRRGVRARLVLAGPLDSGNPAAITRSQLDAWVQEGIIEWWGNQEHMHEVLRRVTIACLPSYREGLPSFLVEASASGVPLVATDVPGCREVVIHQKTGLLTAARDSRSLADALEILLKNDVLRTEYGRAARQDALIRFDTQRVCGLMLELYRDLANMYGIR
jgi:glycosyltransferase involved in cell wall biosynthesis